MRSEEFSSKDWLRDLVNSELPGVVVRTKYQIHCSFAIRADWCAIGFLQGRAMLVGARVFGCGRQYANLCTCVHWVLVPGASIDNAEEGIFAASRHGSY